MGASMCVCPRRVSGPFVYNELTYENKPDDGTCDYCGSLLPDTFMERVEAGDVTLVPTDKNYKVYVRNKGGEPFKQTYRSDGLLNADQSEWKWTTRETTQTKFYFDHLTADQCRRFVELMNEKKLDLDYPGFFYRKPFFVQ